MYTVSLYSPRKGNLNLDTVYEFSYEARSAAERKMKKDGWDQATIYVHYDDPFDMEILEVFEI